jgi:hypothetical protein
MKIQLTILLVIGQLVSWGQESYKQIAVKHKRHNQENVDNIILTDSYELDGMTFHVGQPSINSASWILLIKRADKLLGQINGLDDSFYFRLTFYKTSNQSDPILVFGESASEFYWGQKIIKIENDNITDIGELNVGRMTSVAEFESIIKYLDIKTQGNIISIDFKCNDLIIDPQTKKERRVKLATELSYIIQGDKLLEVSWKKVED